MRIASLLLVALVAGGAVVWGAAVVLTRDAAEDAATAAERRRARAAAEAMVPGDAEVAGRPATAAARDYFLVGEAIDRTYVDPGDPDDPRLLEIRRRDDTAGGRWTFRVPKSKGALELVFGFGGPGAPDDLYLHGFQVTSKSVTTELVELQPPALIGTAANALGGAPHVTPVSTTTRLKVDVLGAAVDVDATLDGTIRAAWSRADAVTVGDETHHDVVALSLGLDLSVTGELFGVQVTRETDTGFDGLLARDFGYVEFESGDDRYRLVPGP